MISKRDLFELFDRYDQTFTLETGEQIQAIYFNDLDKLAEELVKLLPIHNVSGSVCPTCKKLNAPYCSNPWHLQPENFR